MKIALIGATGFVGSHVLKEALSRNHQVTAIVRNPQNLKEQHSLLHPVVGDVLDADNLPALLKGHDVIISAYNAGWKNPHLYTQFIQGSRNIQKACKEAGVQRLLVVGGAGSLRNAEDNQLVDDPEFPAEWKQGALAARDYLAELIEETELDWVFLSPAVQMHPGTSGVKKGTYKTGLDQPVVDENGVSKISVEDLAFALLDEVETPHFHKQRFTIAW